MIAMFVVLIIWVFFFLRGKVLNAKVFSFKFPVKVSFMMPLHKNQTLKPSHRILPTYNAKLKNNCLR